MGDLPHDAHTSVARPQSSYLSTGANHGGGRSPTTNTSWRPAHSGQLTPSDETFRPQNQSAQRASNSTVLWKSSVRLYPRSLRGSVGLVTLLQHRQHRRHHQHRHILPSSTSSSSSSTVKEQQQVASAKRVRHMSNPHSEPVADPGASQTADSSRARWLSYTQLCILNAELHHKLSFENGTENTIITTLTAALVQRDIKRLVDALIHRHSTDQYVPHDHGERAKKVFECIRIC